jgi:AcrR family transcriptional regulator
MEKAYRRSAGTARGEARRRELLERVTDDVAAHGLADFSLRRAARAAGTTHKVLLYHFDGAEDLLRQAIVRLRQRRIDSGMAASAAAATERDTLSARVLALWPVLSGVDSGQQVLDRAIGLAMYDSEHYASLGGREASKHYLPALLSLCPAGWGERRKLEVAEMVLATLRGFLVDLRTSGDTEGIGAGLAALGRALDREEAAG